MLHLIPALTQLRLLFFHCPGPQLHFLKPCFLHLDVSVTAVLTLMSSPAEVLLVAISLAVNQTDFLLNRPQGGPASEVRVYRSF